MMESLKIYTYENNVFFIIVQFVMSLNYKLGQLAFHPYSCLLCANEWQWLSYQ
jgi:hypothetical protein